MQKYVVFCIKSFVLLLVLYAFVMIVFFDELTHSFFTQFRHHANQQPALQLKTSTNNFTSEYPEFARHYEYTFKRPIPKQMEAWFHFAHAHKCHLYDYGRIEKDLKPFRSANKLSRRKTMKEIHKTLPDDGMIKVIIQDKIAYASKVHTPEETHQPKNILYIINRVKHLLPDMTLYYNWYDEPRILKCSKGCNFGPDATFKEVYSQACDFTPSQLKHLFKYHGFFAGRYNPRTTKRLPIFSVPRLDECHLDILIPYPQGYFLPTYSRKKDIQWKYKANEIYFRGSTTGSYISVKLPWEYSHRFRLMRRYKKKKKIGSTRVNVAFSRLVQCRDQISCNKLKDTYAIKPYAPFHSNYRRKYILDIDGNVWSMRFVALLRSTSLVFKAGIFKVFFSSLFKPWKHYIPVNISLDDLEEKVKYANKNDRVAEEMGKKSADLAAKRLRLEDFDCYVGRLLIEYASLFKED